MCKDCLEKTPGSKRHRKALWKGLKVLNKVLAAWAEPEWSAPKLAFARAALVEKTTGEQTKSLLLVDERDGEIIVPLGGNTVSALAVMSGFGSALHLIIKMVKGGKKDDTPQSLREYIEHARQHAEPGDGDGGTPPDRLDFTDDNGRKVTMIRLGAADGPSVPQGLIDMLGSMGFDVSDMKPDSDTPADPASNDDTTPQDTDTTEGQNV